jgi:E3 Ubiquitin ligase
VSSAALTFLLMGVLAAISSALALRRRAATLRRLNAAPEVLIASAIAGQAARITGTVAADGSERVAGAFSGAPGVIAVSERWELTSRGQRLRRLDRSVRATPFVLEDASGRVRVVADDSVDVVVEVVPAKIATSGPNRVFGAGVLAANLNPTQETSEGVIAIGARVSASGMLRRRDDGTLELVGAPKLVVAELR